MKKRLISAAALLLTIVAAITLDWFSGGLLETFPLFTILLLGTTLLMGSSEMHDLMRKWGKYRHPLPTALLLMGVPGAFLIALLLREHGLWLLLYLILVAKMVDNGALFVGSIWGRKPLAPKISPNKTVEGLIGGLLTGTASSIIFGLLLFENALLFSLVFGLLISPLAVAGDLAASFLKRKAGVKDSGTLLPGIGGVLDLMDSILLSAPAGYWLLTQLS